MSYTKTVQVSIVSAQHLISKKFFPAFSPYKPSKKQKKKGGKERKSERAKERKRESQKKEPNLLFKQNRRVGDHKEIEMKLTIEGSYSEGGDYVGVEQSPLNFTLHPNGRRWESTEEPSLSPSFSLVAPEPDLVAEHPIRIECFHKNRLISQGSALYFLQEEVQLKIPLAPKGHVDVLFCLRENSGLPPG